MSSIPASRSRLKAPPVGRVQWDRLGRLAMLCVLIALVYLYVSAGLHMLSTWRQSSHDSAAVASMEREHRLLVHQHEALSAPGTLEAEARQLGMMRKGEQQYVISGLPDN
ncbi:MAG: hypothetical protein ABR992_07475 [Solirubrobacteraceae bacterium]|jgi:hypothetical protein